MVTWMAYAAGVACLLAAGALSLDKLCERVGFPRRFAWLAGLTLALLVPLMASPPEPEGSVETVSVAGTVAADVAPRSIDAVRPGSPIGATVAGGEAAAAGETAAAGPGATDRAALTLWGFASLAALILIGTVLVAAALARRRWDRRWIAGEDVYVSRRFGPALVGVARPAIVIPRWVFRLGDAVGATVVRHEREHARAWDHLALLYSGLVVAAMPWNPAAWWMLLRLRTAVEIDCDRRVVASGIPAAEYGDLLLDIGSGRPVQPFFATTLVGSQSMLERRLKAMRNQGIKVRKSALLLLGCTAVAAMAVACGVPAPKGIAPAVNEALEDPAEAAAEVADEAGAPQAVAPPSRPGRPTVAVAETPPQPAVGQDGDIVIRGINKAPVVHLSADIVARDPLVLVDGILLDGGLTALLAGEPLDIQWVGFSRDPQLIPELGDQASRGMVVIGTAGGQTVEGRAVSGELWRRMQARPSSFQSTIDRLRPLTSRQLPLDLRPLTSRQPPLDLRRLMSRQPPLDLRPLMSRQPPLDLRPLTSRQLPLDLRPLMSRQLPLDLRPLTSRQLPLDLRPLMSRQLPLDLRPLTSRQLPLEARLRLQSGIDRLQSDIDRLQSGIDRLKLQISRLEPPRSVEKPTPPAERPQRWYR